MTATPIGQGNGRPDLHVPTGQRYQESDVIPGRRWQHYRGQFYVTLNLGRESTNGPNEGRSLVIYCAEDDLGDPICVRASEQFLDGRFVPVDDEGE